jgi:hypothetical protein
MAVRSQPSPNPVARLENADRDAGLVQRHGGRQPRHPGADNEHRLAWLANV